MRGTKAAPMPRCPKCKGGLTARLSWYTAPEKGWVWLQPVRWTCEKGHPIDGLALEPTKYAEGEYDGEYDLVQRKDES